MPQTKEDSSSSVFNKLTHVRDGGLSEQGSPNNSSGETSESDEGVQYYEVPYPPNRFADEKDYGWFYHVFLKDTFTESDYSEVKVLNFEDIQMSTSDGKLTKAMLVSGMSVLNLIPFEGGFSLTKLQLSRQKLEDIDLLHSYKLFQCIDLSWNNITKLSPIYQCRNLIILDASHNKITEFAPDPSPVFLTNLNLSFNKIQFMPNFTAMWAIKNLNLSNNFIQRIEHVQNLKYLQYLNLSHNLIKHIEQLEGCPVRTMDLSWNQISHWKLPEGSSKTSHLRRLDLSHNKIESVGHVMRIYPHCLRYLNLSFNKFNCVASFDALVNLKGLRFLELEGNQIMRDLPDLAKKVIFMVPHLGYLNGTKITKATKIAASNQWSLDPIIKEMRTYCHDLMYSNMKPMENDTKAPRFTDFQVPIIILVAPVGLQKHTIAEHLAKKYPQYVKVPKLYSTMCKLREQSDMCKELSSMKLHCVHREKFNSMWDKGHFFFVESELGDSFALARADIVDDGRICILPLTVTSALALKWHGLNTTLISLRPKKETILSENLQKYIAAISFIHKERMSVKEPSSESEVSIEEEEITPAQREARRMSHSVFKQLSMCMADGEAFMQPEVVPEALSVNESSSDDRTLPLWCDSESDEGEYEETGAAEYTPFIDMLKTDHTEKDHVYMLYQKCFALAKMYYDQLEDDMFDLTLTIDGVDSAAQQILPTLIEKFNSDWKARKTKKENPMEDSLIQPRIDELMNILLKKVDIKNTYYANNDDIASLDMSSGVGRYSLTAPFLSARSSSLPSSKSSSFTEFGLLETMMTEPDIDEFTPEKPATLIETASSSAMLCEATKMMEDEGFDVSFEHHLKNVESNT